jgi:hypothetical protein
MNLAVCNELGHALKSDLKLTIKYLASIKILLFKYYLDFLEQMYNVSVRQMPLALSIVLIYFLM